MHSNKASKALHSLVAIYFFAGLIFCHNLQALILHWTIYALSSIHIFVLAVSTSWDTLDNFTWMCCKHLELSVSKIHFLSVPPPPTLPSHNTYLGEWYHPIPWARKPGNHPRLLFLHSHKQSASSSMDSTFLILFKSDSSSHSQCHCLWPNFLKQIWLHCFSYTKPFKASPLLSG